MELGNFREKAMNRRIPRGNLDEYAALMGVDLTLILGTLRLSPTERLRDLQTMMKAFTPSADSVRNDSDPS